MYVCTLHVCACYSRRPEDGTRSCGARVTGGPEPPCGCWEPQEMGAISPVFNGQFLID